MIVIIDYGMGNISSVQNAISYLGFESILSAEKEVILSAEKIILPGVGSYFEAMRNIDLKNLRRVITEAALVKKIPILGICLGMQILSTYGEEDGISKGLNLIPGKVIKLQLDKEYRLPHVGFNNLLIKKTDVILRDIPPESHFYFVHKFHFITDDLSHVLAETDYGKNITTLIKKDNIYGAQFHPEKSQKVGLKLLSNFLEVI